MDGSLIGYVGTAVAGAAAITLARRWKPKVKVAYWFAHFSSFQLPNNVALFTNSVTVQNLGGRRAEEIQIIYNARPQNFQVFPTLKYSEETTPAGKFVIGIDSLGPKEVLTIQILGVGGVPLLEMVRSKDGPATQVPIVIQRQYPRWFNYTIGALTLLGAGTVAYGLYRLAAWLLTMRPH